MHELTDDAVRLIEGSCGRIVGFVLGAVDRGREEILACGSEKGLRWIVLVEPRRWAPQLKAVPRAMLAEHP